MLKRYHAEVLSAFKEESKAHPNFGKAVGLGASKWWASVGGIFTSFVISPVILFVVHI